LVLFQHVTFYACSARGIAYEPFLPINFGRMGVDLFFVISGFVMGQCLGQGKAFILHRAVRIFPPFWIAIALSFLVLGTGAAEWHLDGWSALLLPASDLNNSYMIPYWTLCYEMAFYVATYLLILLKVRRSAIPGACILWILAIAVFNTYRPLGGFDAEAANHFIFYPGWLILLSPVSMLFAFGLLLATAQPIPQTVHPAYLAALALCAWSAALNAPFASAVPSYLLLGVAYGATLLTAQRVVFPRLAVKLGDVSYGFYLVHVIAIAAVYRAIPHGAASPRFAVIWMTMACTAVAVGITYGWLEFQFHARVLRKAFHHKPAADLLPALSAADTSSSAVGR